MPVSSNGALFWRGWSRLIRVVAPRGARLPPLGLKLAGQTKPTLRPTSSTKAHGLQFCITHTLQSHSFMRDCRDRKFGPQMSPMEMLCPYISMLATPAISWRPRSSLARPRVVPDTPGRALHAGGVSLTRLGRPEKSTFLVAAACGAGCDALGATGEFSMQTALRNLRATCGFRVLPHVALRLTT